MLTKSMSTRGCWPNSGKRHDCEASSDWTKTSSETASGWAVLDNNEDEVAEFVAEMAEDEAAEADANAAADESGVADAEVDDDDELAAADEAPTTELAVAAVGADAVV